MRPLAYDLAPLAALALAVALWRSNASRLRSYLNRPGGWRWWRTGPDSYDRSREAVRR